MNNRVIRDSEYVTCALCNSDNTEPFFEDRCFHLVKCKKCGLVYINPRPTQEKLNRMYNLSVQTDKGVIDHTGYMEFAYLHLLKAKKFLSIVKKYKKKGRILDLGCASGFFLNLAKQEGFYSYGVEISENFCSFAKKNFNIDVFCGTLKERNYPKEYFDVVIMSDVLSHLPTPVEELDEVNRVLRKGGLLLIETGNKGELNSEAVEKWGGVWGSPGHLYHFGPKTLLKLLDMTGFDCLNIDKSAVILSSTMEASLKRLIKSRKSKVVSYQKLQVSSPLAIKRALMKGGAHLYFFTKYTLGKLLPKSNVDCTMIVCSKKRRNTHYERAQRLIDDNESCPVLHLGSYEYPSRAHKLQHLFETCLSESGTVLDAGCGSEQRYLSNLHPEQWGVGLDIDRENIVKSKKANTTKNATFIVGDLHNLPFIVDIFDTVVCYDVLEHVQEPYEAIREFASVLKKGGCLLISTSNLFNPAFFIDTLLPNIVSSKIIKKLGGPAYYERTYRFDPWHLMKNLRKCGLSVKLSLFGYPLPVWNPWFYEHSLQKPPKLGYLWIAFDKLTNIKPLKKLKEIMITIAEK